jgi:multidrug efflux pump subunit AcrA (membrane-fusion protein)
MPTSDLISRLEREFTPGQARLLAEEIEGVSSDLVRARDFSELKDIVRNLGLAQQELAEAQKRTEARVEELAEAQKRTEARVEELAEAQKRTEARVEELAEAQKRTEARVEELAEAQKRTEARVEELAEAQRQTTEEIRKLAQAQLRTELAIQSMRQEIGGVANSVGYQLENEAYRHLPKFLADKHGIRVTSKVIRAQVGQEEINILAEGKRGKTPVLIVGEAKSRLAVKHITQLKRKIEEVEKHYPAAQGREIVPVMVAHFAREKELNRAEREGVIVAQSFEW